MDRRAAMNSVGGCLWTVSRASYAAAPEKVYRIGVLGYGPVSSTGSYWSLFLEEFAKRGYVDGQNVLFVYRYPSAPEIANPLAFERSAAELVSQKVDLIVTLHGPQTALAASKATTSIPIVMIAAADPVRDGLVASLARPGGNITGNASFGREIAAKRIAILAEILGKPSRICFLQHKSLLNLPDVEGYRTALQTAAHSAGAELLFVTLDDAGAERALREVQRKGANGLALDQFGFNEGIQEKISAFVERHKLPMVTTNLTFRGLQTAGYLFNYSVDMVPLYREGASYVDRILKGTKPSELPIVQATHFKLTVDLSVAKYLGIVVPKSILAQADEVIDDAGRSDHGRRK